jgi:hypothetical protein
MMVPLRPQFESFEAVKSILQRFTLMSFTDSSQANAYASAFQIDRLCVPLDEDREPPSVPDLLRPVSVSETKPIEPELRDLCRLHWLTLSRRAISVLELGSGFSTTVIAHGLRILDSFFHDWAKTNVRAAVPFHIHSVEEERRFLEISSKRLPPELRPYATFYRSSVELTVIHSHIATLYSKLPNVCPDFIYLDGPSQFATTQELRGFSLAGPERMPMSADILTFEFFLQPGTLILVDGRTANARFLRAHFKRNWAYRHDELGDVHLFELQEEPLGPLNRKQMDFCLSGWLL